MTNQTDNTVNTDISFFERCVQKLSVSGSCIFLVILNHFRPCCLPIAYPCRLHLSSMPASSSIFVASLRQPLTIHFCPIFGTTIFLSVGCSFRWHSCRRSIYILQARAYRSVLCQAQPVCILSAQRSYSKFPAICSQKQKKGTFICKCHFFCVPLRRQTNERLAVFFY